MPLRLDQVSGVWASRESVLWRNCSRKRLGLKSRRKRSGAPTRGTASQVTRASGSTINRMGGSQGAKSRPTSGILADPHLHSDVAHAMASRAKWCTRPTIIGVTWLPGSRTPSVRISVRRWRTVGMDKGWRHWEPGVRRQLASRRRPTTKAYPNAGWVASSSCGRRLREATVP